MKKQEVLRQSNFGERVAEEESSELENYFVETDHWARTFGGEVDIVYGAKGSGKSALYSLLLRRTDQLFDRKVVMVSAEKPRGTPIFRDLQQDPPTSEAEFVGLWKLYLLTLMNSILQDYGADSGEARHLNSILLEAGLADQQLDLSRALRAAFNYVRSYFRRPAAVEGTVEIDSITFQPKGFSGKISFSEPDSSSADVKSADTLLLIANQAFQGLGYTLWILLDRLDVAFAETQELEENALRALFRVYLDMQGLDNMFLKIFLRTDIWKRITQSGFREASHITRHVTIKWNTNSLLNLVMRRSLKNPALVEAYDVYPERVLASLDAQNELFYRMFPDQVDIGPNKSHTFDWILTRMMDGTREPAPREIIHFLNAARDAQLRQHEIGSGEEETEELFSRTALREALPEVSRVRLHQTLFAEYPRLRESIDRLRGEKTSQHLDSLSRIWKCSVEEAAQIAENLAEVGFFEQRGTRAEPIYWIPFLYRDATETVQGTAD